jgi:hypothetical protein
MATHNVKNINKKNNAELFFKFSNESNAIKNMKSANKQKNANKNFLTKLLVDKLMIVMSNAKINK